MISKIQRFRIFLLLFFISLCIYVNVLSGDFLFDDQVLIVKNDLIKHAEKMPLLFKTKVFETSGNVFEVSYDYYRPMQNLLSALDYRIWGLNPRGYHLTNIIIHSLIAFLVFCFIYRLFFNYPLALLSSLLFCVHPIQSEAVCYISGRSELLVSLFTLLTIVFYFSYIDSKKRLMYIFSLFSFVLAFLSREAGFLVFVPFFILAAGLKAKWAKVSVLTHFISFLGILVIYILLRLTMLVPIQLFPSSPFPFYMDALNFLRVLFEYIKLFISPQPLYILRSIPYINFTHFLDILAPIVLLFALIVAVIALIRRKEFVLLFGIGWFVLTLLYLIKFMYKFRDYVTLEEHWVYLASIGLCVILSFLTLKIKPRWMMKVLVVFLLMGYATLSFLNTGHWKDEVDFFEYNLKFISTNMSVVPRLNFITVLYKRKLYNEAINQVHSILTIQPRNPDAFALLGDVFMAMKKYPEAKEAYRNALSIDYFCIKANRMLRVLAEKTGEPFEEDVDPLLSLSEAKILSLIKTGNYGRAFREIEKELTLMEKPEFYTLAGIIFGKLNMYDKAIESFNAALRIDPDSAMALSNLVVIYERLQDRKKAAQIRSRIKQPQ